MDLIELIPQVIVLLSIVVPGVIIFLSGIYFSAKKVIHDLDKALEDDVITREEFELLIKDSLSIVKIFKDLYHKLLKK